MYVYTYMCVLFNGLMLKNKDDNEIYDFHQRIYVNFSTLSRVYVYISEIGFPRFGFGRPEE